MRPSNICANCRARSSPDSCDGKVPCSGCINLGAEDYCTRHRSQLQKCTSCERIHSLCDGARPCYKYVMSHSDPDPNHRVLRDCRYFDPNDSNQMRVYHILNTGGDGDVIGDQCDVHSDDSSHAKCATDVWRRIEQASGYKSNAKADPVCVAFERWRR
jgi:hypothetical protein